MTKPARHLLLALFLLAYTLRAQAQDNAQVSTQQSVFPGKLTSLSRKPECFERKLNYQPEGYLVKLARKENRWERRLRRKSQR